MNDTAREVYYLKTLSVAKITHSQWLMTEMCVQSTGGMIQMGKPMYSEKTLRCCRFDHHKSHKKWPEVESILQR